MLDLRAPHAAPGRRVYVGRPGPGGWRVRSMGPGVPATLWPSRAAAATPAAWGRASDAALEVAWWVLFDVTQHRSMADDWCADFCAEVIGRFPPRGFTLAAADVVDWLDAVVPDPAA